MSLASRPRNSLNDENSHPSALNANVPAGGGQKPARSGPKQQQQLATNERRRILSDISNAKSHSSFAGTPKPSPKPGLCVFRSENLPPKAGGAAAPLPPQSSSQKPLARVPLRNIVNESQRAPSFRNGVKPGMKNKSGSKVLLTVEQLRRADEWAKEDLPIEQTHFTGQDMDALREKMMEAEIDKTVAMVRNYRASGVPSFSEPTIGNTESIYFEDGRLKRNLRSYPLCDDTEHLMSVVELEAGPPMDDDTVLTKLTSSVDDFQYRSIPENWHDVVPIESG